MKTLVVYDSTFGNTRVLADGMQQALGEECRVLTVSEVKPPDVEAADLLIVGSPTQGGRPTAATMRFIRGIAPGGLRATHTGAFDTRLAQAEQNVGLRLLMRVIGFAAPRIARELQARGGEMSLPPEGFIVEGKEGPLRPGELERARSWAKRVAEQAVRS